MELKKLINKLFNKKTKQTNQNYSERLKKALTKKEIYQNKLKQFPDDKLIKLKINILDLIINYLMEIEENGK